MDDETSTFLILHKATSISLMAKSELHTDFASETKVCNSSNVAGSIVEYVNSLSQAASKAEGSAEFDCGDDNIWAVGKCGNVAVPYICVNCDNPCTFSKHADYWKNNSYLLWFNSSCESNAVDDGTLHRDDIFHSIVIEFEELSVAPEIVHISTSSLSEVSILVSVELDDITGALVCGAFTVAPLNIGELQLRNQLVDVVAFNMSVTITGLQASSDYTVYCSTFSALNVPMTVAKMMETRTYARTACCRVVTVNVLQPSIYGNVDVPKVIRLSIETPLPQHLNITLRSYYHQNSSNLTNFVAKSIFAPYAVLFTPNSNSHSQDVAFISSGSFAGLYELDFQLGGKSSPDFEIVYATGSSFVVLDVGVEPDAPQLKSARFDDNGMSVNIVFDSPTDRASFSNIFSCEELFTAIFIDETTICIWKNDVYLHLITSGVNGANLNDTITLLPHSIKAKCQGDSYKCEHWDYGAASTTRILPPVNAIPPKLSIVAPGSIGPCDDFLLDMTGSTGAGGRPYASISITVDSIHPNVSTFKHFLSTIDSVRNPVVVPTELMHSGFAYNFVAVLCTFFGSCGRISHQLVVSKSMNVPVISINSDKIRSIHRFSPLLIRGNAYVSECGGTTSTRNLIFEWSLFERDSDTQTLTLLSDSHYRSLSSDSRIFKLNPFTLVVGRAYMARLTVTHAESLKSSTDTVDIFVTKGNVVAVLGVPSRMGLQYDGSFLLDAGESYDEDVSVDEESSELVFSYECIQLSPVYSESCDLDFEYMTDTSVEVYLRDPTGDEIGNIYDVRVVVQHISDLRSSEEFIEITILPAGAPKVSLKSESKLRINPSEKVKLIGEIEYSSAGYAFWDVSDESIDLDRSHLFDKLRILEEPLRSDSSSVSVMSLVLPPFVLPPQSTFTFSLSCILSGGNFSNVASVTVSTNSPPQPGLFLVFPRNGTMLETEFSFSAVEWEDVDRPMSYDFGYQSTSGSYTVSRSRQEISYFLTNKLPSGYASADYELSVRLQVFDILNAKSVVLGNVRVEEKGQISVGDMQSFFSSGVEESNGYSDGVKEVVATVSNLVNKVNCTLAPNCNLLGREGCSTVAGTCGKCLDGYIGDDIPSNDKCYESNANARHSTSSILEECDSNNECFVPSKSCPSDCSGHGVCHFVSLRLPNMTYSNCTLVDFHCIAKCVCVDGYGGIACESTSDDFQGLRDTRHQIVQAIRNISLIDDPTAESLSSWFQSLADVCSNSEGLHDHTKVLISELAIEFIGVARELKLPYEDLHSVRATLDLVLSALSMGNSVAPANLLDAYASFISSDMIQGQNEVTVVGSTFRLASFSLQGSTSVLCNVPQSVLESTLGQWPQSAIVPESTTSSGFELSLVELSAPLADSSDYLSAPLGLRFGSSPCNYTVSNASCFILVTLQYSLLDEPVISSSNSTNGTIFTCGSEIENKTATCPNGETLNVYCNGTAGTVYQQCPLRSHSKICASIGRDSSTCTLLQLTASNITCRCSLIPPFRRRQLEENSDDSEISIDFVTAGTSILQEFSSTWRSVDDLTFSRVLGSWEVLLTLGLLAVISVTLLIFAWREDKLEAKRLTHSATFNDVEDNTSATLKLLLDGKMRRKVIHGSSYNTSEHQKCQNIHDSLNSALPSVLQPIPLWAKCKDELKLYHRWAGIYFHFSKSYTRPLRLLTLLTNVILFLFVDALTYDLRDPDDGQCELERDYDGCLSEPSSLSAGKSKCYWNEETSTCHIRDTDSSLSQILTVAIFASLIGTPFAVVIQVMIQKFLAAETRKDTRIRPSPSNVTGGTYSRDRRDGVAASMTNVRAPRARRGGNFLGVSDIARSVLPVVDDGRYSVAANMTDTERSTFIQNIHEELPLFYADMRKFRDTLNDVDKKVFDRVWGISGNDFGKGGLVTTVSKVLEKAKKFIVSRLTKTKSGSSELILLDNLQRVHTATRKEMRFFEKSTISDARKNKRLIFLFIKDLLGSTNSKILESKEKRDNRQHTAVPMSTKLIVWCFILFTLGAMLFYVYLFAMRQTPSRQSSWFKTFMIWLLFELFLVSSAVVLVTHVVIPSFILDDLKRVREKIAADIRSYRIAIDSRVKERKLSFTERGVNDDIADLAMKEREAFVDEATSRDEFNAAKYLFVSNHIARAFRKLPISGSVLTYSTQWPQQSMTSEKHLSDNYNAKFNFIIQSASRVAYFFLLGVIQFPEPVQDCFVELVSTSGLGYFVIVLVTLYQISPLIVLVPVVVIATGCHFIISSSRKSSFLPKETSTPPKKSQGNINTVADKHIRNSRENSTVAMLFNEKKGSELRNSALVMPTTRDNDDDMSLEMECQHGISHVVSQFCNDDDSDFDSIDEILARADENFSKQVDVVRSRLKAWDSSDDSVISSVHESDSHELCDDVLSSLSDKNDILYLDRNSNENIIDEDMLARYNRIYTEANAALLHFLVNVKGDPPEKFEFGWDEDSDEYKYFYKEDIVPFIDNNGCEVSYSDIVERRLQFMKDDVALYNKNRALAKEGTANRERFAIEWDNYRLYDSDVVLPFIDFSGKRMSESMIHELRAERQKLESTKEASFVEGDIFKHSMKHLYEAKQFAEYDLLIYTENFIPKNS